MALHLGDAVGQRLLHLLLDYVEGVKEIDQTGQDLIFENIRKDDPTMRIVWGTAKHIDRKAATLRLSVHFGFAKGFLPAVKDGANLIRALGFPLHLGPSINSHLVTKLAKMISGLVDPSKLGNGFVVEEVHGRKDYKRLMITEELAHFIEHPDFDHRRIGSMDLPSHSAKKVHHEQLRLHIKRYVLSDSVWTSEVMQELGKQGYLAVSVVPHRVVVPALVDTADEEEEYNDDDDDDDGYYGSSEERYEVPPLRRNTHSRRVSWVPGYCSPPMEPDFPPSIDNLTHGERQRYLRDLADMRQVIRVAAITNVPARQLLAARGFVDPVDIMAELGVEASGRCGSGGRGAQRRSGELYGRV